MSVCLACWHQSQLIMECYVRIAGDRKRKKPILLNPINSLGRDRKMREVTI